MNKALFLDRDGTIIHDKRYMGDPALVELIPGSAEALRMALEMRYLLFLFTNQSGVGRGYFTMEDVLKVNRRMEQVIGLRSPLFTDTCIAPETPDETPAYRKPSPRFILEMIRKHDLDPARSYVIGDANSDLMAGINAGIPVLAISGPSLKPDELPLRVARGLKAFPDLLHLVRHLGTLT